MLGSQEIKRRIDAARTLHGMTQTDLAELLHADGFGKHDLGRIERGELPLRRNMIDALCRHLSVPPAWFEAPDVVAMLQASTPALEPEDDVATQLIAKWEAFEAFAYTTSQDALSTRNAIFGEIRHRLDQIERNQRTVLTQLEGVNLPALAQQVADLDQLAEAWAERFAGAGLPAPSGELARRLAEADRNAQDRQRDETPGERDAQPGNG